MVIAYILIEYIFYKNWTYKNPKSKLYIIILLEIKNYRISSHY